MLRKFRNGYKTCLNLIAVTITKAPYSLKTILSSILIDNLIFLRLKDLRLIRNLRPCVFQQEHYYFKKS